MLDLFAIASGLKSREAANILRRVELGDAPSEDAFELAVEFVLNKAGSPDSLGARVEAGRIEAEPWHGLPALSKDAVALVFREWLRRQEYGRIARALRVVWKIDESSKSESARERMASMFETFDARVRSFGIDGEEMENPSLEARAQWLGLDAYEVCERAAVLEYEGGASRWYAEELALAEAIKVREVIAGGG